MSKNYQSCVQNPEFCPQNKSFFCHWCSQFCSCVIMSDLEPKISQIIHGDFGGIIEWSGDEKLSWGSRAERSQRARVVIIKTHLRWLELNAIAISPEELLYTNYWNRMAVKFIDKILFWRDFTLAFVWCERTLTTLTEEYRQMLKASVFPSSNTNISLLLAV